MLTITIPAHPVPADAPDLISTVYVVNWEPASVGGFEWSVDRAEAESIRRELDDPTARLHTVAVPAEIGTDPWQISEWLDAEGWSDGIDPRR